MITINNINIINLESIYSIIMIEEVGSNHDGLHFENDKGKILVLPSEQPHLS